MTAMMSSIVNGSPVEVVLRDGTKETVELRALSIRDLYRWIEHFGTNDTPARVCLCTGKPAEWVDSLSDESFGQLAKLSFDQNFPRATALSLKDMTVASLMIKPLNRFAEIEAKIDGSLSKPPSPAPAPSASAVETGNASST